MRLRMIVLAAAVAAAGCQTTETSGTAAQLPGPEIATDLSDLVGVRGSSGEMALSNRGYEFTRAGEPSANGKTAYYYNAAAQDCVRVFTSDGRYQSIDKVPRPECRSDGGAVAAQQPDAGTPTPAEQACMRDVTRTTNNPEVVVLRSSFSQAGTEVIVGVGEQRAPWRCIAYSDGATAGIQSLTNEGFL